MNKNSLTVQDQQVFISSPIRYCA